MTTIASIIAAVAAHHGIKPAELTGHRRWRSHAWPRQEAYWLAQRITGKSLPEIGRAFGGRDHTTVLHGIRAVEDRTTEEERNELLLLGREVEKAPPPVFRSRRAPEGFTFRTSRAQRGAEALEQEAVSGPAPTERAA